MLKILKIIGLLIYMKIFQGGGLMLDLILVGAGKVLKNDSRWVYVIIVK